MILNLTSSSSPAPADKNYDNFIYLPLIIRIIFIGLYMQSKLLQINI